MIKAHTQNTHLNDCQIICHKNHELNSNTIVIGIDEVGRGSLFGQMTVGAVILDNHLTGEFGKIDLSNTSFSMINDSKKLSEKKRNQLFEPIKQYCQSYAIIDVPAFVIDEIDIYQATLLGMRLAIENLIIINQINPNNNLNILIDGNATPILSDNFKNFQKNIQTLIKGDGIHSSIACAGILAKVYRDNIMNEYAKLYPNYQIDKHKGYASKAHRDAIMQYGILKEHRKSFNPMRTMIANGQGELF
ncbi:ribonuclease HII [Moraxella oblonga]|uniref:ribonuclease HII n=1 Tax=Moraxella oblonga TaxID=200413 RepID=UPI0008376B23|nr:ribonuclease HII [Moraxella oblonga]